MKKEIIKHTRPEGFFPIFERRPGPNKMNMHYCPGCGHGVLHKLIAEAIADLGIKDKTVMIAPVGCSVFVYYYFDCRTLQVAHGRAPAAATALARSNPEDVVISYQGDGDLASIGFNHILQAANRGENMCVFFVNNAIYGMTGGQMAPTTLIGQVTTTTPLGRDAAETGYPIKAAELISQFKAPVYVERCSLTNYKNIMKARMAVRKALQNQMDKKGFSFVEFLSPCPINLKMSALEANEFVDTKMTEYYPLGVYKDEAADRQPIVRKVPTFDAATVKEALYPNAFETAVGADFQYQSKVFDEERRVKIAGFGGQGVLSLGYVLATMGKLRNFNVSWLPSYGPEMRGGTANCSVVFSKQHVGSPEAAHDCSLLICLNQPSIDKFVGGMAKDGILIYDSSVIEQEPVVKEGQTVIAIPASEVANQLGDLRMANIVLLGAISHLLQTYFIDDAEKADIDVVIEEGLREHFSKKPAVAEKNIGAFRKGKESIAKIYGALAAK